jgi:hypothetical protein
LLRSVFRSLSLSADVLHFIMSRGKWRDELAGLASESESDGEDVVMMDEAVHIPGPDDLEEAPSQGPSRVSEQKLAAEAAKLRALRVASDSDVIAGTSSAAAPPTLAVAPTRSSPLVSVQAESAAADSTLGAPPRPNSAAEEEEIRCVAILPPPKRAAADVSADPVREKQARLQRPAAAQDGDQPRQEGAAGLATQYFFGNNHVTSENSVGERRENSANLQPIFARRVGGGEARLAEFVRVRSTHVITEIKEETTKLEKQLKNLQGETEETRNDVALFEKSQDEVSRIMFQALDDMKNTLAVIQGKLVEMEKKLEKLEEPRKKVITKQDLDKAASKVIRCARKDRGATGGGSTPARGRNNGEIICFKCRQPGHKQRDCPQPERPCRMCGGNHRPTECPCGRSSQAGQ